MKLINSKGNEVGICEHRGIKLDIGCGNARRRDCIGIDVSAGEQVDVVRDLEQQGLPFCDRSVERIYAHNILEHIGDGFDFLMKEMWRILQDGGVLDVSVPGAFSDGGMRDPTHKRHFTLSTWDYFKAERPRYHSYMENHPWKIIKREGDDNGTILVHLTPDRD